jgi:hypothetical protein
MAMLGPLAITTALESLKGEIEAGNNNEKTKDEHSQATAQETHTNSAAITHHFKMSETHTIEGEYQKVDTLKDDDVDNLDSKIKSNTKCSCFSFLRVCRKK